ncbi:MAG: peptidase U32 family protein [Eubacteriales bacterium]
MNKKIELLAPAGDLEKFKTALDYGADAVYFGGEMFSLRAGSSNLSIDDIKKGVDYAHSQNKKAYLTTNIYAHNEDIEPFFDYLKNIKDIPIDAFLISDPGIMMMIKDEIPNAEIHLSTQANMTNLQTAKFWASQGVKRIVLARELTLNEIADIKKNLPQDIELEAFVHGAMCISYSGRCLLSNFMIGRDANKGECAHPCRWKYHLIEEKRPDEYYEISEDSRGTYIMNSKDLCMIEHIPDIINAGISSAKIEGRMKSAFYVATVVSAYRKAIDEYYQKREYFTFKDEWMNELKKVSHREFTTGFYYQKPSNEDQNYQTSAYTREYSFVGIVKSYDDSCGVAVIEQRNKMVVGDEIEIMGPYTDFFTQKITSMQDIDGNEIESAPHAQQIIKMKMQKPVKTGFILRKRK